MNVGPRLLNRAFDLAFVRAMETFWSARLRGSVLCLLYHRIDEPGRWPFLDRGGSPVTTPAELDRDVAFWRRRGARFATFSDLRSGWFPAGDETGVIICFDDGFRDTYEHGLPVLERHGAPGTVFQISGLVGARELLWEHRLYLHSGAGGEAGARFEERAREMLGGAETGRPLLRRLRLELERGRLAELLDWADREIAADGVADDEVASRLYPGAGTLARAVASGHEIGSHGNTHQPRSLLSDVELERELATSRQSLAECLGSPPAAFSFPFGEHQSGDREILSRHYAQAAIVARRPIGRDDSPWALPRCSWPGSARGDLRWRRWLLTGGI